MKKLLVVLTGVLCVTGFVSIVWAHGPKAGGPGFRSQPESKTHFKRHSHPRKHFRHKRHFLHKGDRRLQRQLRRYGYYRPYYSPSVRYSEDIPPIEKPQPVPQHSPASQIYFNANPEPWFLYGRGDEFRQMGLIPPLPQASQELK